MGFALPKERSLTTKQETVKAAAAFADYVAMGPKRSLRALAEEFVRQGRYKSAASAVRVLKQWSTDHHWQSRLAESITTAMERNLERAAELDADTFFKTSVLINNTIDRAMAGEILVDPIESIKIRETVRKPTIKGATNVNVHLDIQISQILDQIAEEDGLTEIERREFEADIKEYLAEAKS